MNDDRAAEGVEHLQAAALEMIEAARAFLDVAENLIVDRERIGDVFATVSTLADVARGGRAGRSTAAPHRAEDAEPQGPGETEVPWWASTTEPGTSRLQRIDVS